MPWRCMSIEVAVEHEGIRMVYVVIAAYGAAICLILIIHIVAHV